jgi:hypothetical protein
MKRRTHGFSVAELAVSTFCLALISSSVFVIFKMCSSNFQVGLTRQGLQSQLLIFSTRFSYDTRQSSIYSASVNPRTCVVDLDPGVSTETVTVHRDAVCLAALRDPNDGSSYESGSGLPRWDSYWIYAPTTESPTGKLVRYRVDVAANTAQRPFQDFVNVPGSFFSPPPGNRTAQTLARGLYKLEGSVDYANQQVVVRIAFRGDQGRAQNGRSLADVAETLFRIKPENSWPRM